VNMDVSIGTLAALSRRDLTPIELIE